jgi:hypothetical protein
MIKRLLVVDPLKRITIEEIKKHNFYLEGEKQLNNEEKMNTVIRKKIEEKTLNEMISIGFTNDEIEANLNKCKHNEITTTYDLLFNKFYKQEKTHNQDTKKKNNHEISVQKTLIPNSITPKAENSEFDKKHYENNINIQIKYEKNIGNININISEPNEIHSKSNQAELNEQFTFKETTDLGSKKQRGKELKIEKGNEKKILDERINKEKYRATKIGLKRIISL